MFRSKVAHLLRYLAYRVEHQSGRAKRYDIVVDACRSARVSRILEIGTCTGATAISMILAAQSVGNPNRVEYWGLDLFEEFDPNTFGSGETKPPLTSAKVLNFLLNSPGIDRNHLHLVVGNTAKTLPQWVPKMPQMDIIFIDGGHSERIVREDWSWCRQLMHAGTRCFFDDYTLRPDYGVVSIVGEIVNSGFYGVRVHDVPADEFHGYIHRIAEVWLASPLADNDSKAE